MTIKALKLLLTLQTKAAFWFITIYFSLSVIILIAVPIDAMDETSWFPVSMMYTPKIYLLIVGAVYPLLATKLFVSQGLTRRQFFTALTGAISIVSLLLLVPVLACAFYTDGISLLSVMIHYFQMPLFLLIGWTSVLGYQLRKWYLTILGIIAAIAMFHFVTTIPEIFGFSDLTVFGSVLVLLATALFILSRAVSQIPLNH